MPINPEKRVEYNKNYYSKNRDKILEQKRSLKSDYHRKKKREYDKKYRSTPKGRFVRTSASKLITFEMYLDFVKNQKGLCAVCSKKCSSGKNLSIDHCHKRNVVRGLLCGSCNLGLGKFNDDISLLKKAILYLQKSYETS